MQTALCAIGPCPKWRPHCGAAVRSATTTQAGERSLIEPWPRQPATQQEPNPVPTRHRPGNPEVPGSTRQYPATRQPGTDQAPTFVVNNPC
jgi:hypothetical protein